MSESSASPVRVSARALGALDTNDCSDLKVREAVTAELTALPFLGSLTCPTSSIVAGSTQELVFTYTVGQSGIADSGWLKLCFRFYSDWDLQTADPQSRDFASARLLSRSLIGRASADSAATAQQLKIRYDVKGGERPFQKALLIHVVDGYLRPGDVVEIRLGDRRFGGPGTRVQTFVEDEFEFHLFVDPLGTSRMARAGRSLLAIVPGPPHRLAVNGPRLVRSDSARAELRVHLQDRWGNACRDIAATAQARVGETTVASADFPTEGWATATMTVPAEHRCIDVVAQTASGPLGEEKCYLNQVDDFPSPRAFFADLHVHSNDTVGTQDTPSNLAYGRDVGALDVIGYTANDFQITDDVWADVVAACRDVSDDGRLVCYPGVEWCGTAGVGGDHNVVFLGHDTTLARSLEWHQGMASSAPVPQTWPITQLYAAYDKDPDSLSPDPACRGASRDSRLASPAVGAIDRGALRVGNQPMVLRRCGGTWTAPGRQRRQRRAPRTPRRRCARGEHLRWTRRAHRCAGDRAHPRRCRTVVAGPADLGDDRRARGCAVAQRSALDG